MKNFKILIIASFTMSLMFGGFSIALAQTPSSTDYELLAPIPQLLKKDSASSTNATAYLPGLVKLIIGLATALAVIMLMWGGIQYMSTDAWTGKTAAKDTIQNALVGLLLVISSWLILYTINPRLVEINLNIKPQPLATKVPPPVVGGTPTIPPGPVEEEAAPVPAGVSAGNPWPSDATVRREIQSYFETQINKNNCTKVGEKDCTSLAGMSSFVVNKIKGLALACKCGIEVTGGTEYWLHGNKSTELALNTKTGHKPGGKVVDLKDSNGFNNYVRRNGTKTTSPGCSELGSEKYILGGDVYVHENAHWHVCFR